MERDDIAWLRLETDDIDPTREGLQAGVGPGGSAEGVHHREGVFVAIEVERLEARAAAGCEVFDAGVFGGRDGGQKVGCEDAGPVDGLEAVAEGGAHEADFLLAHGLFLVAIQPGPTKECRPRRPSR